MDKTIRAFLISSLFASACSPPSSKALEAFTLKAAQNPALEADVAGAIDGTSVRLILPYGAAVQGLVPTLQFEGKTVSPASGVAQDFTLPVTYRITAADGSSQEFTATAALQPLAEGVDLSVAARSGAMPNAGFVDLQLAGPIAANAKAGRLDGGSLLVLVASTPGHVAAPLALHYRFDDLVRRGLATANAPGVTLPVYGLHAGADNALTVRVDFRDGSAAMAAAHLTTAPFAAGWIYANPNVRRAIDTASNPLGYSYYYIKSGLGTPVVMDVDGEVRWVGTSTTSSISSLWVDGAFLAGDQVAPVLHRYRLDGTVTHLPLPDHGYLSFHHDFAPGKTGVLAAVNVDRDGIEKYESNLIELDPTTGDVLAEWDLGEILSRLMTAGGDDPALFVRYDTDWFHLNEALYDPRDDSLLVSSRENFVLKIDYQTGEPIWIFGDTSKYWFTFPSLQAKALALVGGGLAPIGQHSITIDPNGRLLLFDNGFQSVNVPPGEPAGASRPYSAVSSYAIDGAARTAEEVWRFDYDQSISSLICGSAVQVGDGSLLVTYAYAGGMTARLVGLDPQRSVAFDLEYPTVGCTTAWNAHPLAFESLQP